MLGTQDTFELQGFPQAGTCFSSPAAPDHVRAAFGGALVGRTLADVERHLILDTLAHCLGNRTHAARLLGISIRTLRNKINAYMEAGIAVPEPGQRPASAA